MPLGLKDQINAVKRIMTPVFFEEMLKYGIWRLYYKFGIKYDIQRGISGIMIEDVLSETLESFTRKDGRVWNKESFPEFKKQVISAFDSRLHGTIRKALPKAVDTVSLISDYADETSDYEETISFAKLQLEKMGATELEQEIFEPYYVCDMKRDDIAEYLGVSVQDVTNAGKRLDRKIPALRIEMKELCYGK